MRTARPLRKRAAGARDVVRAIEASKWAEIARDRRTTRESYNRANAIGLINHRNCQHCGAAKDEGTCTNGCDDLEPCPICHEGPTCTCTSDDRHFYELALELREPNETISHAMQRARTMYFAKRAADATTAAGARAGK